MIDPLSNVSVVIVTYKGDDLLRNCLASLFDSCGSILEIVVLDNSPSSATKAITEKYSNVIYVANPVNSGFAGGNNIAIGYCKRDYVLLLNNDTIVHSRRSIDELVAFFDGHPRCAAAQGTGTLPRVRNTLGGCGSYLTPLGVLYTEGFAVEDDSDVNRTHSCFCVSGFFMLLRKSALDDVGGYPFRSHFWCYYEEVDLCHRLWNAGHEVWYVKTLPIEHLLSVTSTRFDHSYIMRRYLRNIVFSLCTNLSAFGCIRILPAFYGLFMAHAVLSLIKCRAADVRNDFYALCTPWRERKRIFAARRIASRQRVVSDKVVFKSILKPYPIRAFLSRIK